MARDALLLWSDRVWNHYPGKRLFLSNDGFEVIVFSVTQISFNQICNTRFIFVASWDGVELLAKSREGQLKLKMPEDLKNQHSFAKKNYFYCF